MSRAIKGDQPASSEFRHRLLLLVCTATAILLFWRLGYTSLRAWDEAIYAQIAKEMVQTGDWLTPHYRSEPWFEKPPLLMWTMAALYRLFGVTEFWSRFPSALCGTAVAAVIYLMGELLYSRAVGLVAVIVLLSTNLFVDFARSAMTDMMLTFLTFLALYAYLRMIKHDPRWWYAVFAACAAAVMVKSAAAFVAPAAIGGMILLDGQVAATLRAKEFWIGLLLGILLVTPWHVYMYLQHGRPFLRAYVGFHIISRAASNLHSGGGGPEFYVEQLREQFWPWFYLSPFAIALAVREILAGEDRSRILLLVIVPVFVLYTLVQTKFHWYVLPLVPALAVLIGEMTVAAWHSHSSVDYSAVGFAAGLVAMTASVSRTLKILVLVGAFGLVAIAEKLRSRRLAQLGLVLACGFLTAVGVFKLRTNQLYTRGKAPNAKLAAVAGSTGPGDIEPLIVYRLTSPSIVFYSNRPVQVAESPAQLASLLNSGSTHRLLLSAQGAAELATDYHMDMLYQADTFVYAVVKGR